MELIEGISNEVLLAFIVTILLIVVAVFYTFSNERTNQSLERNVARTSNDSIVDGDGAEARDVNNEEYQGGTNVNDSSTANETRETQTSDLSQTSQEAQVSEDDVGQEERPSDIREGNVRRRVVKDSDLDQERFAEENDETMVVKVKHNENIQTFNVSLSITVIELKRLAFNNELNAGRRVRFVYAGQLLRNDNDLLTRYGVQPNTVVHCVVTDPPEQAATTGTEYHEEDLDLSRLLIPLLTVALIMAWYGLISYKHIFTGSSIVILMFLTSLYVMLVYVTTVQ